RPAAFVMENVKGLLSSKVGGGYMFPRILDDLNHPLKALGRRGGSPRYNIFSLTTSSLLASGELPGRDFVLRSEVCGVPQSRHRVIRLGLREDVRSIPTILDASPKLVTVEEVIGDLPPLRSGLSVGEDSPAAWL